ncbi:MAG TPA: hypothetical protein VMI11_11450 [Actinomycetes bacterium]|nr:hypothetical protein [Actinomycetes bacterium]
MSRSDQRRRRALRAAAPVAGLLAVGLLVWQGSTAAFSATTTNTGNAWATGNLGLTNNGGTGSFSGSTTGIFAETGLKPGSTGAKCITVSSSGTLAGNLRLYRGTFSGLNATNLATNLNITVDAQTGTATTNVLANCTGYTGGTAGALYSGTLNAFGTTFGTGSTAVALTGTPTERVVYRIGWTFPSSVTDNTLQGSNVATDFTWEVDNT